MALYEILMKFESFYTFENLKLIFYIFAAVFLTWKFTRNSPVKSNSIKRQEPKGIIPGFDDETVDFIPYKWIKINNEEMIEKSKEFYHLLNARRTIRSFSQEPVPREVIDYIIKTAGTSPSGAHKQPWTFVIVTDSSIKSELRKIVEDEEEINYKRRMRQKWVSALKFCKTNWIKPYIDDAPYIILVFKQLYSIDSNGQKLDHYYVEQSLSLAVGILITAIHSCGLSTLTSTPLNCGPAISSLIGRPKNEKLVYLLPVGFPASDCKVPNLTRKSLDNIAIFT
ncbi:hypothetical protein CHUAL_010546 [Chamberlinius hualienensis]